MPYEKCMSTEVKDLKSQSNENTLIERSDRSDKKYYLNRCRL